MKAIALEPLRYNDKRIEAGEEFDLDGDTWKKIKDKNIVKVPKFGTHTENKIENKIENKVENKGGKL
jgi:hypothetical protein